MSEMRAVELTAFGQSLHVVEPRRSWEDTRPLLTGDLIDAEKAHHAGLVRQEAIAENCLESTVGTEDGQEGIATLREKRKPEFYGK